MPWVETESLSFTARHDSGDAAFAERTLDRMEELRLRLEDRFEDVPGDVTVVVHTNPAWLALAHPSCRPRAGRRPRPGAATWPAGRWRPSCTCSTTPTWSVAPPATTRARRCAAPPSASTPSS